MAALEEDPPSQSVVDDRNHHKMCTQITPIPLPADDCDRVHSMHAALSSLGAATASFDAAMDSLLATSTRHRRRVADLERRVANFRAFLRRLDEVASSKKLQNGGSGTELDGEIITVYCPGSYESALGGMESELNKIKGDLDENQGTQTATSSSGVMSLSNNAVRSAADAAIRQSLRRDVAVDDGQAVPSDAWLDHATMGLGVGKALEASNQQCSVPLIFGEDIIRGEMEYQHILDKLVQNASVEDIDRLESLEETTAGDDESVYSMASQMSYMSVASSSRMPAGQRRRLRKHQQGMMQGSKTKLSSMHHTALSPHPESPSHVPSSALAGRQQSLVGSQPYLCEVFHDSFGIGMEPAKGLVECSGFSARNTREGGTEFYPPSSHITDLHLFNTTRKSYGIVKPVAVAPNSGNSSSEKVVKDDGNGKMGPPDSPTTTASKKKQYQDGKPSLANLAFNADAQVEGKDAPTFDLPASLPDLS